MISQMNEVNIFIVVHDLNDNGDLDMGQMGYAEPSGFSNNTPRPGSN